MAMQELDAEEAAAIAMAEAREVEITGIAKETMEVHSLMNNLAGELARQEDHLERVAAHVDAAVDSTASGADMLSRASAETECRVM
jgi:t-SNARE complex subunit (syntaxin)